MTAHWTPTAHDWLVGYLGTHYLGKGLGDRESACSIAAINLALTGEMTDDIPDCMSEVLGCATIPLQDFMPDEMLNSGRYKSWLLTAAGTGRDHETERLAVLMDWMWGTVLPQLQDFADDMGFGTEWRGMCEQRTPESACAASDAAHAAHAAFASAARAAADAAYSASDAADHAASDAAHAARDVGRSAYSASRTARPKNFGRPARVGFWRAVDPIGVLERMTKVGED